MASTWPELPDDAISWLRYAFEEANRVATERLLNVPNIRETALDDGLVESLIPLSAPRLLPSQAVVEMQIHNIGGLRRLGSWETADIGVLIFVYSSNKLIAQKIGLLQSKRLYPNNLDVEDDDPISFAYGMNAFLRRDGNSPLGRLHRQYEFTSASRYEALKAGADQVTAINSVNEGFGEAVHYLLYNPPDLPTTVRYPASAYQTVLQPPLGCRVFSTADVHTVLKGLAKGDAPTIGSLQSAGGASNWRLEDWVELLLRCKVGQMFDKTKEQLVSALLERRSGPIGAAIAVSIALPRD